VQSGLTRRAETMVPVRTADETASTERNDKKEQTMKMWFSNDGVDWVQSTLISVVPTPPCGVKYVTRKDITEDLVEYQYVTLQHPGTLPPMKWQACLRIL
jgi:hypothetical protein